MFLYLILRERKTMKRKKSKGDIVKVLLTISTDIVGIVTTLATEKIKKSLIENKEKKAVN